MNEFYHVSREGVLNTNVIELNSISSIDQKLVAENLYSKEEFAEQLSKLYPEGISNQGRTYLLSRYQYIKNEGRDYIFNTPIIESTFELVRQLNYADQPSRFESFFGCLSKEDARKLINDRFSGVGEIYKVSCESYFKKDMNLLFTGGSFLGSVILANKYWKGLPSANPFWEVLMKGRVNILDKVS